MGENLVEHRRSAMATENCVNGGHDYPDIRQQLANAMADDKTMSIAVVAELSGVFNAQGFHLLQQDLSQFDAHFFNISPMEAKSIDPQQRLMLKAAYEAFENAGVFMKHLSGSDTEVYVAAFGSDYDRMLSRDPEDTPFYRITGTELAVISNRISYSFNLKGPSLTLDTGCSGSLVALHQACQSIRSGETRQALVGGANLILDPELTNSLATIKFLEPSGRCFSFDDRANGYGRGEGIEAVVLKPLVDALANEDPIRAVIRNSAVNQDGKTQGLTMPNGLAQENMMRKAYGDAELDPRESGYIEAHGTGTEVGDAIEAEAIVNVLGRGRTFESPIIVGSIKANVEHTESVAGIAGFLKTVLALEKGMIPPNHDFEKLSKRIEFENLHLKVPNTLLPWPSDGPRRGSVNSFDYGGTNAHAIIDDTYHYLKSRGLLHHWRSHQASAKQTRIDGRLGLNGISSASSENGIPESSSSHYTNGTNDETPRYSTDAQRRRIFILSENSEKSLHATATNVKNYVSQHARDNEEQFLNDLAHTLCQRRTLFNYRIAPNALSTAELFDVLGHLGKETVDPHIAFEPLKLCFVFIDQGAQWSEMARKLFDVYSAFIQSINDAEAHFIKLGAKWKLTTEL